MASVSVESGKGVSQKRTVAAKKQVGNSESSLCLADFASLMRQRSEILSLEGWFGVKVML